MMEENVAGWMGEKTLSSEAFFDAVIHCTYFPIEIVNNYLTLAFKQRISAPNPPEQREIFDMCACVSSTVTHDNEPSSEQTGKQNGLGALSVGAFW